MVDSGALTRINSLEKLKMEKSMEMSFLSHALSQEASACPVNRGTCATLVWLLYHTVLGAPIYRGLALHYLEGMR